MEQITLRDVGNKQIYDSYMGILRISPNTLDGEIIDDTYLFLSNPKVKVSDTEIADRKIILSDSDGFELGAYFIPRVKSTVLLDESKKNLINVTYHVDSELFVSQSLHARSTIIVNNENQQDKVSPLQVYVKNKNYTSEVFDVVTYPIESPHDESYFNAGNKLKMIDYDSSVSLTEQMESALYNQSKEWYDNNVLAENKVKIDGKVIFTTNKDDEEVPILYTKDYILGSYNGHTARMTDSIKDRIIGSSSVSDKLENDKSVITKLSFIQLDEIVWDCLRETLSGQIRHKEGRYTALGPTKDARLTDVLFHSTVLPEKVSLTAPILGTGISPGIVMHHAMRFSRFAFHILRQELKNYISENNASAISKDYQSYIDSGKITPIKSKVKGFINNLTKEYLLCDGKEITYENYPYINTTNNVIFQVDDHGNPLRDENGKPLLSTDYQGKANVYNAIKESHKDKLLKTPSLLPIDQNNMRYIRGLNWSTGPGQFGEYAPMDVDRQYATELGENNVKIKILDDDTYGAAAKNFTETGNYRGNTDYKLQKRKHYHFLFYNSASSAASLTGKTKSVGTILSPYMAWYYRPYYWCTALGSGQVDAKIIANYSFYKHNVYNGKHYTNSFIGKTPIPSAGMWAWKLDKDTGEMKGWNETSVKSYYIQNKAQDKISDNLEERKKQLIQMNMAEAMAPIATKGGCTSALTTVQHVACKKSESTGHHNRMDVLWQSYTGGYSVQADKNVPGDIYRYVTSLPMEIEEIEHQVNNKEEEITIQMGDKKITNSRVSSDPPSVVLLPLFKI